MYTVILLFILWFFRYANRCPCDGSSKSCYRTEFYGFQYGHLFFYTLLGALYPDKFWFWITLGIVWEIFEHWLSMNPKLIRKFGGCLSIHGDKGPIWMRRVYGNERKHENFIDRALGIQNSTEHTWHYSVGENLTNIIGFTIGKYLRTMVFM